MQGNKIDDLYPKLWAKRNNRSMLSQVQNEDMYVMIDFVEIG